MVRRSDELTLAEELGIDRSSIAARMALLGLSEEGRDALRGVHDPIMESAETFIDTLYRRFDTVAELAALLSSAPVRERLRGEQLSYLDELFGAPIDERYVERRLRMGAGHHRVGLAPQWFLAAYGAFVCDHLPAIFANSVDDRRAVEVVAALVGRVFFDASLALDAYELSVSREVRSALLDQADERSGAGPDALGATPAGAIPTEHRPSVRLHLATDDAERRRHFLGLDRTAIDELRWLIDAIDAEVTPMLADFYTLLRATPVLAELVPEDVVPHLLEQVGAYWRELTRGRFDRPYAASRMRVGIIHEEIGLAPQHYLAGLSRQLCALLRAVARRGLDTQTATAALVRAVLFDVTYVIDAYIDARAQSLLRNHGYASRLVSRLADGVAIVDARNRIQSANARMVELIGIPPGVLQRIPLSAAVRSDGIDALLDQARAARSGRASMVSTEGARVLRITAIVLDLEGAEETDQLAVVIDDVSELVHRTASVRDEVRRLDHVLATVSSVAWELDAETHLTLAISRPVQALTGWRDTSFIGRTRWIDIIDEADRAHVVGVCRDLQPGQRAQLEHRIRRADGTTAWVRSDVCRSVDHNGTATIVGVSVDISELLSAQDRRIEAVGHLAGAMAHELNNALTVVEGNLDLLAADGRLQAGRQRMAAAKGAVEHMGAVTAQLLSFAGRQALRPIEVALDEVVEELSAELRPTLAQGSVSLELDLGAVPPTPIDRLQVDNAIRALVQNGRDAMVSGGTLTLSTRSVAGEDLPLLDPLHGTDVVEVSVADTGPGMSPEVLSRATEPFFTTKAFGAGSGLGLSAVQGFMTQSGGRLLLTSSAGQGTVARLQFPAAHRPTSVEGRTAAAPAVATVLVVDDHPGVRTITAELLRDLGHHVLEAESADEAFSAARRSRPDVLLTDVVLGAGIDGVTLARVLHERDPELAVIIVSGYPERTLDLSALDERFQFMAKPINIEKLHKAIVAARSPAEPAPDAPTAPTAPQTRPLPPDGS